VIEFEFWYLLALPLLFGAGWLARGFESRAQAIVVAREVGYGVRLSRA